MVHSPFWDTSRHGASHRRQGGHQGLARESVGIYNASAISAQMDGDSLSPAERRD
jgi:hypothetical protein